MITVSIVTYKTDLKELTRCLNLLFDSGLVSRVFIVDNSREKYIEEFCYRYTDVIYIGCDNVGYGAGHNQALRRVNYFSGDKYHLVINSDVYFKPGVLGKLVEYMDTHKDVAQVQPRIVLKNGYIPSRNMLPTPMNLIFRIFLPKSVAEEMNYKYWSKYNEKEMNVPVPYHLGSFMFFRTECLMFEGRFDERFFMYLADVDITRRMHRCYRTMFWPKVTVIHARRTASHKSIKMLIIYIKDIIKYFNKWGWIFDKERSAWNKRLFKKVMYHYE